MSDKVVLDNQEKLTGIQVDMIEEIQEHLVKVQSLVDVLANSIEAKNTDNKLDLASELNSLVLAYDELEYALQDTDEVLEALKGVESTDEEHD